MRSLAAAFLLALAASPGYAATCAPVSTESKVLASADRGDIHPDWNDGSTIGLSWTLDPTGDEEGADGEYFIIGDLINPRGNVVNEGVYAYVMEWECDEPDE